MADAKETQPNLHEESLAWQRMREGDLNALAFFYNQYFSKLHAYGKRVSHSNDLAEDCIQDLFFKVWEKREKLPDVHTCQGYLFQAYRRLLSDRLKESAKKNKLMIDTESSILSVQDMIIHDEIDAERIQKITRGIASLSKKQQEIIYLRFYQGLSYDEISNMLEINNQSIRNAVSTSLKFLKKLVTLSVFAYLKMIA